MDKLHQSSVISVLNFALTLEIIEATFYKTGLGASGLVTDYRIYYPYL